MAAARNKRLLKEVADCEKDKSARITVEPVNGDISNLIATIVGPEGTPYEGGVFKVSIQVPPSYPFVPLKMKFVTRVYHANISSQPHLSRHPQHGSPVLTLKSALLSLQSLLCSPEPKDPQDAVVAQHYLSDRKGFDETARYWTQMYASPDGVASGSKPAPPPPAGAASSSRPAPAPAAVAPTADRARLNGIDAQHADQFAAMGFDRERVIDVLIALNYRGRNVANVSDDQVLDKLFSS